ncbi:glycosyltransferase family 2 protein [Selenomonas ruminantium]|uniref:Glycosyl transferase family 2 n=1 Tax=Selenomonas ruminantium TaxID=971 RepID=A0A1I0YMH2_SELRU|nr:glycosyltransferase family 2 protein [Selenomonas ruminantium]SFB13670.1 Glycosyl transferase family 2 [Selenomonas ruminantium]
MKITACYIVKNEAASLAKSLASIQQAVDEIIVVDTGSTDQTKEIAQKYRAQVYDMPWQDDFSLPRNYALSKAKGDWVIFLDADEYFPARFAKKIRPLIKKTAAQGHKGVILIRRYDIDPDADNEILADAFVMRILYNNKDFRYEGSIHEELLDKGKSIHDYLIVPPEKLHLLHTGYRTSLSLDKARRNLSLLLKELETTDNPGRLYGFLADAYLGLEDADNAWKYAIMDVEQGRRPTTYASRSYRILLQLAVQYHVTLEERYQLCCLAVKNFPELPEFHAELAECLAGKENFSAAIMEMNKAFSLYHNYQGIEPMLMDEEMIKMAKMRKKQWERQNE